MRIIAGKLKGRRVNLPRGSRARPVTGKVLELAMNLFGPERLEDGVIADLCAGSGLIGFEAVSRGARLAFFVEASPHQARQLNATAGDFEVTDKIRVLRTDARRCFAGIKKLLPEGRMLSAVFIDPPYIPGMARELTAALGSAAGCGGLLSPGALVILRTPDRIDEEPGGTSVDGLEFVEKRPAGNARLWLYRPAD